MSCPCGTGKTYEACCKPIHGGAPAPDAETLMRARYAAYVKAEIGFLRDSLAPEGRAEFDEESARQWAQRSTWKGLTIHSSEAKGDQAIVQFTALYELEGKPHQHDEIALFKKEGGRWMFVDGRAPKSEPVERESPKVGRNDPCSCGSGKKYKKCHGAGA